MAAQSRDLFGNDVAVELIGWRATEFLLVHSEVGCSTYHTPGRWRLRD